MRRGGAYVEEDLDHLLAQRGFLGRLFRPMFRLVSRSWHMYPLGMLFGLGFDTATEVGLLGISAAEASKGLPIWSIMVFPALFTAAMSLIDTTDGVLMLGAYGWALHQADPQALLQPDHHLRFGAGRGADRRHRSARPARRPHAIWKGRSGRFIGTLNDNFGSLGYLIIAIFAGSWLISIAVYRLGRFDRLEPAQ